MNNLEAAIYLILSKDGDRDLDAGSNLTVEESMAIVDVLKSFRKRVWLHPAKDKKGHWETEGENCA